MGRAGPVAKTFLSSQPEMIGGDDKGPPTWIPSYPTPSHPPPLQLTSNASGLETSEGDGLVLGGSPLRIAPTHTVQSNPAILCILLSLGVLRVPVVCGFYALEAFFVIIMNQRLCGIAMVEAEGGSVRSDVRGRRWGRMPTSPWETRCHGWDHPESDPTTRIGGQAVYLRGDPRKLCRGGEAVKGARGGKLPLWELWGPE